MTAPTQIEGPNGFEDLASAEYARQGGRRRYQVGSLVVGSPSEVIDCGGWAVAWLMIDAIATNPASDAAVFVNALSGLGGLANPIEEIIGPGPLMNHKRPVVTSAGVRRAGWLWNPPRFITLAHFDASGDFDVTVELTGWRGGR